MLFRLCFIVSMSGLQTQALAAEGLVPQALERSVSNLDTGEMIRLQLVDERIVEGRFLRRDDINLLLVLNGDNLQVPMSSIDELWERSRATGRGAKIGGIVSGLVVGGLTWFVCGYEEGTGESCDVGATVLAGTLIGAALGASSGALIGAAIPKWNRVYQRAVDEGGPRSLEVPKPHVQEVVPEETPMTTAVVPARRVGSSTLLVGYASIGSVGMGADAYAHLGPFFSLGGEVDYFWLGEDGPLFEAYLMTRFSSVRGNSRIFGSIGVGGYRRFDEVGMLWTFGVGLRFPTRLLTGALTLETRWQAMQGIQDDDVFEVMVGWWVASW